MSEIIRIEDDEFNQDIDEGLRSINYIKTQKLFESVDKIGTFLEAIECDVPFFIAGGSIYNFLGGGSHMWNDIDVFFYKYEDVNKFLTAVQQANTVDFQGKVEQGIYKGIPDVSKYLCFSESPQLLYPFKKTKSYIEFDRRVICELPVQFVTHAIEPTEVHLVSRFDFKHIQCWVNPYENAVYFLNQESYDCFMKGILRLNDNLVSPYHTLERFAKNAFKRKMKYDRREWVHLCNVVGQLSESDLKAIFY